MASTLHACYLCTTLRRRACVSPKIQTTSATNGGRICGSQSSAFRLISSALLMKWLIRLTQCAAPRVSRHRARVARRHILKLCIRRTCHTSTCHATNRDLQRLIHTLFVDTYARHLRTQIHVYQCYWRAQQRPGRSHRSGQSARASTCARRARVCE